MWTSPGWFLSSSPIVQKMAVRDEKRGCYVIRPSCQEMTSKLLEAMLWPRSPEQFGSWLVACDFLLIVPRLHEVAFAIQCSLDHWQREAGTVLKDCTTSQALAHTRREKNHGLIERLSLTLPQTLRLPDNGLLYGDYLKPDSESSREKEEKKEEDTRLLLSSIKNSSLAEKGESVTAILAFLCSICTDNERKMQRVEEKRKEISVYSPLSEAQCPLKGPVLTVTQVLQGLTNTAAGSQHLLGSVKLLCSSYGVSLTRHFVHRCFCCLYLAETFREMDLCCLPLELVHTLQCFYQDGTLGLSSFVPARGEGCHVLPGLYKASEVHPVVATEQDMLRQAVGLVPWLAWVSEAPSPLHLTGSFLCWCRTAWQDSGPPPSDVDIFCEDDRSLEPAATFVGRCMLSCILRLCPNARVVEKRPNPYRIMIQIQLPTGSSFPDEIPSYMRNCDMYVNSHVKVGSYHLPQVRASLFLGRSQRPLFLTASAAVAWITMLNIDYSAFRGSKTPFEIIAKCWLWGFNICLSAREALLIRDFLHTMHPCEYESACKMNRPTRLVLCKEHVFSSQHSHIM